ncbi:MAG: GHKL domain-containing protein [Clostridium sartagoforme]|nr:GHKL domain-containing protein [Clostridium sartagoforme]
MYTGLIDTINSIIQSIIFVVVADYCVMKEYKKSKLQMILLSISLWIIITTITYLLGNSSLSIIIIHIVELLFLVLFAYKKDKLGATIGFTMIYLIIGITVIISFSIFTFVISNTTIDTSYANILIMYLPQFLISYLILKNMKTLYKINLVIKSRFSSMIALIITTLTLDFAISFLFIYNDKDNPIFKEIIFIFLAAFIIFITIYFTNIDRKANEINNLNIALESKINELKKIKHDYGSQISYLYGAYLMGNYDKLGELLKGIIAGHDISSQVKVISSESSIIAQIINSTNLRDVDVIIEENAKLEDTKISELDLHKIISNIIRNSIEALEGKGLLMIKSYYNYNHIVITIQNNGHEIKKDIIDKIFEEGFSTKKNKNGDNGFGLHIVKEIISKHNGSIGVSSNPNLTTFTIKLPLYI